MTTNIATEPTSPIVRQRSSPCSWRSGMLTCNGSPNTRVASSKLKRSLAWFARFLASSQTNRIGHHLQRYHYMHIFVNTLSHVNTLSDQEQKTTQSLARI